MRGGLLFLLLPRWDMGASLPPPPRLGQFSPRSPLRGRARGRISSQVPAGGNGRVGKHSQRLSVSPLAGIPTPSPRLPWIRYRPECHGGCLSRSRWGSQGRGMSPDRTRRRGHCSLAASPRLMLVGVGSVKNMRDTHSAATNKTRRARGSSVKVANPKTTSWDRHQGSVLHPIYCNHSAETEQESRSVVGHGHWRP